MLCGVECGLWGLDLARADRMLGTVDGGRILPVPAGCGEGSDGERCRHGRPGHPFFLSPPACLFPVCGLAFASSRHPFHRHLPSSRIPVCRHPVTVRAQEYRPLPRRYSQKSEVTPSSTSPSSARSGQSAAVMGQNRHSPGLGTRRAGASEASWPINCERRSTNLLSTAAAGMSTAWSV